MSLSELKVGDSITFSRGGMMAEIELRKITAITKTFIVDSNSEKWTMRGKRWGIKEGSWNNPYIAPTRPGDEKKVEDYRLACFRSDLIYKIKATKFDLLPTAKLSEIFELTKQADGPEGTL